MDLHDLQHNTRDGIHIASLAGAWSVAVAGFGGMRDFGGRLSFAPRLPRQLQRLAFRVVFRGRKLAVEVTGPQATYQLLEGAPLEIAHHGSHFQVSGEPVSRPIPPLTERTPPSQPPGRAPQRRSHEP